MNKILIVLGILALIGAAAAMLYTVTSTNNGFYGAGASSTQTQPYYGYALPLAVAGFVLLVVGLAVGRQE